MGEITVPDGIETAVSAGAGAGTTAEDKAALDQARKKVGGGRNVRSAKRMQLSPIKIP